MCRSTLDEQHKAYEVLIQIMGEQGYIIISDNHPLEIGRLYTSLGPHEQPLRIMAVATTEEADRQREELMRRASLPKSSPEQEARDKAEIIYHYKTVTD